MIFYLHEEFEWKNTILIPAKILEPYQFSLLAIEYIQLFDMIISLIFLAREPMSPQHKIIVKSSVQTTVQLTISLRRMKVLIIVPHIFAIDFHESLDYYDPNNYRR